MEKIVVVAGREGYILTSPQRDDVVDCFVSLLRLIMLLLFSVLRVGRAGGEVSRRARCVLWRRLLACVVLVWGFVVFLRPSETLWPMRRCHTRFVSLQVAKAKRRRRDHARNAF